MKKICSIPFSFRALQTEVLFKIALYRYTHVLCNMGGGGGQSFLGFPNTKREKLTQGRVFRRDICGLESWLSFRGKKHFHFSQFTILIFFCSVPREAPRHLKCDVLNSTAIRVRWSAPLQSQGGRIRGYVVFYTKVDDLGKELIPPEEAQVKFTASEHQLVRISS